MHHGGVPAAPYALGAGQVRRVVPRVGVRDVAGVLETHQDVPKLSIQGLSIPTLNREFGNNLMCHPVHSLLDAETMLSIANDILCVLLQ